MKHKIIYIVLLTVTIQLPASSNECGKITQAAITENPVVDAGTRTKEAATDDTCILPVSPLSRLFFNL